MRDALGRQLRNGKLPALLAALGCAVLLYGFLRSPDFVVQRVAVHGVVLGDADLVVGASQALDASVFTVDSDASAVRVANLPTVERASVHTELPDRVVIDVVERTPVLTWQAADRTVLLDARGHVLLAGDAATLPRLVVEDTAPEVGDSMPVERVGAALAIADALGAQASELRWSDTDGFSATFADGRIVLLGDAGRVPLKLAVLTAILQQPDDWSLLDVSEPDRPYYK
jgi:cell division protein FtsQ